MEKDSTRDSKYKFGLKSEPNQVEPKIGPRFEFADKTGATQSVDGSVFSKLSAIIDLNLKQQLGHIKSAINRIEKKQPTDTNKRHRERPT